MLRTLILNRELKMAPLSFIKRSAIALSTGVDNPEVGKHVTPGLIIGVAILVLISIWLLIILGLRFHYTRMLYSSC